MPQAMIMRRLAWACCLMFGILTGAVAESAPEGAKQRPVISIIIDDIGYNLPAGMRAIGLPGAIAYAFLPHTPHAGDLARLAHGFDKEVILHAPMQSITDNHLLGPGALTLDMSEQEFAQTLHEDLESIPHVIGINNHMGSLLTQHPGHMVWLMRELGRRGDLFFVDSLTTERSVVSQVADEHRIPTLRRDIFLDAERNPRHISGQFYRLVDLAHRQGYALGIGHPYPETLRVLERMLPQLESLNVNLIPLSEQIKLRRSPQWQASLSPSPRAAKNSRP